MALKAVPFFTSLNDRELDVVRAVAAEKSYQKNVVVLTEGEMGDSLYMIQSGKVKVFIGDEDGREIILKILGAGDFFGEMSMIDKQPRSASVTTPRPRSSGALARRVRACIEQAPRSPTWCRCSRSALRPDRKIGTLALMDVYGAWRARCSSSRSQQRQADGEREALAAGSRQHGRRLARDGEPHPQGPLGARLHLDRVEVDHDHQPGIPAFPMRVKETPPSP
jgi:hypothetical protein